MTYCLSKKENFLFIILFFILICIFFDFSFCEGISDPNLAVQESSLENAPSENKEMCGPWKPCSPDCPCGMNRNMFERYADWLIIFFGIITTLCFF
jgi:hypothetical protein